MTLMLHAGANAVSYDALRAVPIPPPTDTHVPVPHHEIVELMRYTLGFLAAVAWMTSAWYGLKPRTWEASETTMPKQSLWNGYAALLAALSALVQISTSFLPVCRGFG